MRMTFADTAFYVAMVNPVDELHAAAVAQAESVQGDVITTEYVLVELGNRLARSGDKKVFVELLRRLEGDPRVVVVPADPFLFRRGVDLLADRLDKDWSLTDCISFVVMNERGISECADRRSPFRTGRVHGLAQVNRPGSGPTGFRPERQPSGLVPALNGLSSITPSAWEPPSGTNLAPPGDSGPPARRAATATAGSICAAR